MTDDELQAIEARVQAVSPGPWECDPHVPIVNGPEMTIYDEGGHTWEDANFIAHARQDVPALIAEVKRLRAELAKSPPG